MRENPYLSSVKWLNFFERGDVQLSNVKKLPAPLREVIGKRLKSRSEMIPQYTRLQLIAEGQLDISSDEIALDFAKVVLHEVHKENKFQKLAEEWRKKESLQPVLRIEIYLKGLRTSDPVESQGIPEKEAQKAAWRFWTSVHNGDGHGTVDHDMMLQVSLAKIKVFNVVTESICYQASLSDLVQEYAKNPTYKEEYEEIKAFIEYEKRKKFPEAFIVADSMKEIAQGLGSLSPQQKEGDSGEKTISQTIER